VRRACLWALSFTLLACERPSDGVLDIAFLLAPPPPSESRQVPTELEAGVSGGVFARAEGRCDVEVPAGRVRCVFAGLPASNGAGAPLSYELRFLLWYDRLPARFDARALDRDPGGRDPDAPPPPMAPPLPRFSAGPLLPDPFGAAERTLTAAPGLAVDRIAGAELILQGRWVVLDGRVGNLVETGTAAPAPVAPSPGHQH
jgi:hypothetical protein